MKKGLDMFKSLKQRPLHLRIMSQSQVPPSVTGLWEESGFYFDTM